jgi:hypothetical protein
MFIRAENVQIVASSKHLSGAGINCQSNLVGRFNRQCGINAVSEGSAFSRTGPATGGFNDAGD